MRRVERFARKLMDERIEPKFVYATDGRRKGRLTGGKRICLMDGCSGRRLAVRWKDGKLTYPCRAGMFIRKDGEWQIEL